MIRLIGPFISPGERVLDIGAGGGWVGEGLAKEKGAKVTLVDVADLNKTNLSLTVYDGRNLPFPDGSFDVSLLLFVLHHCEDPLRVLQEAVRAADKRVVIYEDTYASSLGRAFTCFNDFISNAVFFISDPHKMNMPYNYKKVEEWEKIFADLSLRILEKRVTKHAFTRHVLFVLEKS